MSDPGLMERYEALRDKYFTDENGHVLPPVSKVTLEWSNRLTSSAGVCYPQKRTIRLSTHYHKSYPDEVDSTLLHEMIHLLVPGHGKAFWEWMSRIQARGGRVSRHSKERATRPGPNRWRYTCTRCGASWERRRRLPHGGRSHVHKRCGGALKESKIARPSEGGETIAGAHKSARRSRGHNLSVPGASASGEAHWELLWPGKDEAIQAAWSPSQKRLVPVPGASDPPMSRPGTSLTPGSLDASDNLLIEGDNLDALKLLRPGYSGRVKLIYIDPPYNTGKQFVYSDQFRQSWLSMMAPRLLLARDLLRDDGVIVIHIDEHELHNLLHLMAELFGEENHLGNLVWDKGNPKGDATGVAYQHESVVVYSKDRTACVAARPLRRPKVNAQRILQKAAELFSRLGTTALPTDLASVAKKYGLPASVVEPHRTHYTLERVNEEFSAWVRSQEQFSGGEKAYCRIDEEGNVYRLVSMAWPNKQRAPDGYFDPLNHPVTGKPCPVPARGWRYAPATMRRLLESGEVVFGPDERTQPQRKYLLKENLMENIPSVIRFGGSDDASLAELGIPFENPKPVRLAAELISYFAKDSGDIVLDFFAGSGTTGHAVLELNKADGRNRRFVLVQSPEPTAARSAARAAGFPTVAGLTRARLERVCDRFQEGSQGPDFRIFRVTD